MCCNKCLGSALAAIGFLIVLASAVDYIGGFRMVNDIYVIVGLVFIAAAIFFFGPKEIKKPARSPAKRRTPAKKPKPKSRAKPKKRRR